MGERFPMEAQMNNIHEAYGPWTEWNHMGHSRKIKYMSERYKYAIDFWFGGELGYAGVQVFGLWKRGRCCGELLWAGNGSCKLASPWAALA